VNPFTNSKNPKPMDWITASPTDSYLCKEEIHVIRILKVRNTGSKTGDLQNGTSRINVWANWRRKPFDLLPSHPRSLFPFVAVHPVGVEIPVLQQGVEPEFVRFPAELLRGQIVLDHEYGFPSFHERKKLAAFTV